MRAVGLNAIHICGSGEPDGFAVFVEVGGEGERKITLEAKSSGGVPNLAQLDLAGVREHMDDAHYKAHGCLLVAPSYPKDEDESSAVSNRATTNGISCWTVEQLASFVDA